MKILIIIGIIIVKIIIAILLINIFCVSIMILSDFIEYLIDKLDSIGSDK